MTIESAIAEAYRDAAFEIKYFAGLAEYHHGKHSGWKVAASLEDAMDAVRELNADDWLCTACERATGVVIISLPAPSFSSGL